MVCLADGFKEAAGGAESFAAIGLQLGADVADAPLLTWCQGKLQGPTGPLGFEQQGVTGGAADALDKVGNGLLTTAQGHGIDADNPISGPQADAGGGLASHHTTDQHTRCGRYARRNPTTSPWPSNTA